MNAHLHVCDGEKLTEDVEDGRPAEARLAQRTGHREGEHRSQVRACRDGRISHTHTHTHTHTDLPKACTEMAEYHTHTHAHTLATKKRAR